MVRRDVELAERLADLNARMHALAGEIDVQIEAAAAIIESMDAAGLLPHREVLGPKFRRDDGPIVQAALLIPEGFGVCRWPNDDGDEADVRGCFHPFAQCTDEEKSLLGPFIHEMLEDLHDTALIDAARREPGDDVPLEEYFSQHREDDS